MKKVSVIVATYNHEKYIGKALESIVSQETDFEIEALVGDDASKDGTGKIVEEYGRSYHNIIKPIIRRKNLGAFKNILDLIKRAEGEYIAFLEGDDYWIDEHKLQKQIDFLDNNRDFVASFGISYVVDENDNRHEETEQYVNLLKGNEYTVSDFNEYFMPGQTATAVYRRRSLVELLERTKKDKRLMPRGPVFDRFLVLGVLSLGRIHNSQEYYAAYRYVLNKESGSWSSKNDYYSLKNVIFFIYGLKEMERIGKLLDLDVNFDKRRLYEFRKAGEYKKKMPILLVDMIRFFVWIGYRDKREFHRLLIERHKK